MSDDVFDVGVVVGCHRSEVEVSAILVHPGDDRRVRGSEGCSVIAAENETGAWDGGCGQRAVTVCCVHLCDFAAADGIWTCGKEGQSVPVGVGTPTIKLDRITVGGTPA